MCPAFSKEVLSTHVYTNFFGVKASMGPFISVVFSLELCQGSSTADRHVIGMEERVNDKLPIIYQACIIYC